MRGLESMAGLLVVNLFHTFFDEGVEEETPRFLKSTVIKLSDLTQ